MTIQELRNTMNQMGEKRKAFLFMIDFDMQKPQLWSLENINPEELLFDINGKNNVSPYSKPDYELEFSRNVVSFDRYKKAFELVQYHLQRGDTYLLNLTLPTPVESNYSLKDIFYSCKAKYKLWFKDQFVVYSPEVFIRIEDNIIYSHPMKGTIDAAIPNAEQLILEDEKERAEHVTIVDLIRNDLSMVAKNVRVEKYRYIDRIQSNQKELLQVSSVIAGDLDADYHSKLGDIVVTLLPAGSICGAPKKKTIEVIKQAEQYDRGYYTGVCGIFDGEKLDCGVMIRYIENTASGLIYKSGGGVTLRSKLESEYQELIDKVYVPII
ncbi:MAG: aminodeoxychorismate synthase component I [Bacteroidales bacterium]|nr:aminodeoxychorismate synthase component I [Bacteroidales bacterium]